MGDKHKPKRKKQIKSVVQDATPNTPAPKVVQKKTAIRKK